MTLPVFILVLLLLMTAMHEITSTYLQIYTSTKVAFK